LQEIFDRQSSRDGEEGERKEGGTVGERAQGREEGFTLIAVDRVVTLLGACALPGPSHGPIAPRSGALGREGGRKGGRKEGREGGREGGKKGGREGGGKIDA
jgi:hypothetical protein